MLNVLHMVIIIIKIKMLVPYQVKINNKFLIWYKYRIIQ